MREHRPAALVGVLLLAACGGNGGPSPREGDAAPVRGAALVVGSSLQEWALLVVPRSGGLPQLRALENPGDSLWTGRTRLPATQNAYRLTDGSVALQDATGRIYRYDPGHDDLSEAGVADHPGAPGPGQGRGAWIRRDDTSVLLISESDSWTADVAGSVGWAALTSPDAVALAIREPEAPERLRLAMRSRKVAGTAPARAEAVGASQPGPEVTLPGLVTTWGRQLVFADLAGRGIMILNVPELAVEGRVPLGGPVMALAASPSSHEIYAALGTPSQVVAIGRLSGRTRKLSKLPAEVVEIRPSLRGSFLVVRVAEGAAFVPLYGHRAATFVADWRPDLPLGLPGERVLATRDGTLFLWKRVSESTGEWQAVSGPGDAWWIPVRWRPPPPRSLARAEGRTTVGGGEAEGQLATGARPSGTQEGLNETGDTVPSPSVLATDEVPVGAAEELGEVADRALQTANARLSPGFYAIVASSQSPEGIVELRDRLSSAGFPAAVQRHRDEASELWYRTLVGPYETREEAQTAARQLRRERGLQAWISEIGPEARPEDLSP